jgi:hypothetical protein
MREAMFFAGVIVFSIVIGAISNELGLTNVALATPGAPPEPSGGILANIFGPLQYVWDAATAFFQIITYQVEGIPALISTMLILPLGITAVWLILRLIRGGG